jgi:hypothetical protein
MDDVVIAGVGIHPFGRFEAGYRQLGAHAAVEALADAGVAYDEVEPALVPNVGAEMAKGHNAPGRRPAGRADRTSRPHAPRSAGSLFMGASLIESGLTSCSASVSRRLPEAHAPGHEQWQIESGPGANPSTRASKAGSWLTDAVRTTWPISVKNHRHWSPT